MACAENADGSYNIPSVKKVEKFEEYIEEFAAKSKSIDEKMPADQKRAIYECVVCFYRPSGGPCPSAAVTTSTSTTTTSSTSTSTTVL